MAGTFRRSRSATMRHSTVVQPRAGNTPSTSAKATLRAIYSGVKGEEAEVSIEQSGHSPRTVRPTEFVPAGQNGFVDAHPSGHADHVNQNSCKQYFECNLHAVSVASAQQFQLMLERVKVFQDEPAAIQRCFGQTLLSRAAHPQMSTLANSFMDFLQSGNDRVSLGPADTE